MHTPADMQFCGLSLQNLLYAKEIFGIIFKKIYLKISKFMDNAASLKEYNSLHIKGFKIICMPFK